MLSIGKRPWLAAMVLIFGSCFGALPSVAQPPAKLETKGESQQSPLTLAPSTGLLQAPASPIDLASALRLAGVQNPEILLALQRVEEAAALHQLAAAQFLPSLNAGT